MTSLRLVKESTLCNMVLRSVMPQRLLQFQLSSFLFQRRMAMQALWDGTGLALQAMDSLPDFSLSMGMSLVYHPSG